MTCHHGLCKPVALENGALACSWSPLWKSECEVRWILTLPLRARDEFYLGVAKKRGEKAMRDLESSARILAEKLRSAGRSPFSYRSAPTTRSTPASTGPSRPGAPSNSAGQHGLDF